MDDEHVEAIAALVEDCHNQLGIEETLEMLGVGVIGYIVSLSDDKLTGTRMMDMASQLLTIYRGYVAEALTLSQGIGGQNLN